MSRAHRIVKTRYVCVSRLPTNKTYEMNMFHSAILKLGLERTVLANQQQNIEYYGSIDDSSKEKYKSKSKIEMQAKKIDELLKKGAYDVFRDDNYTEAK